MLWVIEAIFFIFFQETRIIIPNLKSNLLFICAAIQCTYQRANSCFALVLNCACAARGAYRYDAGFWFNFLWRNKKFLETTKNRYAAYLMIIEIYFVFFPLKPYVVGANQNCHDQ